MIKIFFLQNEYIFSGYKNISQMRYIFFSFSVKKVFSVKKKKKININFFFHIKLLFSANNAYFVYFVKNTNIFSKKKFFFQLSFATNEQLY